MPDLNDVVRHVILRIIVDQSGLAEELAAARAKVKGLNEAEKASNKERTKDADKVTEAIHRQSQAMEENRQAHEAARRASGDNARSTLDAHKASTKAVNDETTAVKRQIVEEAKAGEIRQRTDDNAYKKLLERQKQAQRIHNDQIKFDKEQADRETRYFNDAESRVAKQAEDRANNTAKAKGQLDELIAKTDNWLAKTAEVNERVNQTQLDRSTNRTIRRGESEARVARQDTSSAATTARRDYTTTAAVERADANAEAKRLESALKTQAAIETREVESGQRIHNRQEEADERLHTQRTRNADAEATQRILNESKVEAARVKNASGKEIAGANVDRAQSGAQVAAARAQDAEHATNFNAAERVAKAVRAQEQHEAAINKLLTQNTVLGQRAAEIEERRARAGERSSKVRPTFLGSLGGMVGNVQQALRGASDANPDQRISRTRRGLQSFDRELSSGRGLTSAIGKFFGDFRKGEGEFVSATERMSARWRGFKQELRSTDSGGGGAGGNFLRNFSGLADSFTNAMGRMAKGLLSWRGLIVVAITALGPLAAMLGAVGAAALGLASNLVSLVGVFAALPGLITAAVSAFGGLALAMGPLHNIISSYSAAQKQATSVTHQARNAALDYRDAVLSQQQAQLAYERALVDAPRSILKLSEARRQAARDIQDYRLALQKLKFDEEGAQLGVESAEQSYRRALADPAANNLERREARHGVEGALFDKRDQKVAGQRLVEDSSLAFKRGVEGSDQVVNALRAVQDATLNVDQAFVAWQKSLNAVDAAKLVKLWGNPAAAQLAAQLKALPPLTRQVAEAVIGVMKGPYKQLRDGLSENIFGPLAKHTKLFNTVIQEMGTFLNPASKAMGALAEKALLLLTNPSWKAFFSQQGGASAKIVKTLGDALLHVADAFRTIITESSGFTQWLVDGVAGAAKSFDAFFNSTKQASDGLTKGEEGRRKFHDFLDLTKKRIHELWPVLKNIIIGFAGFFRALNTPLGGGKSDDFTTKINKGLLGISQTFADLGAKASDPNGGFMRWLRNVGPLLKDVMHFLGQVGSFFGQLFSDPKNIKEAQDILRSLADTWLPALADIFKKLSESQFISKLVDALGKILTAFDKIMGAGGAGALSTFVDFLAGGADLLEKITRNMPGLASAIGLVARAIALIAGAALFAKLTGILKVFRTVVGLVSGLGSGGGVGLLDSIKDKVLGRSKGESAASREASQVRSGVGKAAQPGQGGVLPTLYRMEGYLRQIVTLLGGHPGTGAHGGTTPDDGRGPKGGPAGGAGGPRGGPSGGAGGSEGRPGRGQQGRSWRRPSTWFGSRSPWVEEPDYNPRTDIRRRVAANQRRNPPASGVVTRLLRSSGAGGPIGIADARPIGSDVFGLAQDHDVRQRNFERAQVETEREFRNSPTGRTERRLALENSRRRRQGLPPLPPGHNVDTARGNDLTRSERIDRRAQTTLIPEALEEDRRRDAAAARNNRPSAGRLTAAQRRREQERARYDRRYRSTVTEPGMGVPSDVPVTDEPRRRRTTMEPRLRGDEGSIQALPTNGRFLGIPLPGAAARQAREAAGPTRIQRIRRGYSSFMDDLGRGYNPDERDYPSLRAQPIANTEPPRKRRFSLFPEGDSGSIALTRSAPEAPERVSVRPSRRTASIRRPGGRFSFRGRGGGLAGGLLSGLVTAGEAAAGTGLTGTTPIAGVAGDGYDTGYRDGYDQALMGGQGLDPSQLLPDGRRDRDDEGRSSRRRRGTIEEEQQPGPRRGRGGGEERPSRGLSRLFQRGERSVARGPRGLLSGLVRGGERAATRGGGRLLGGLGGGLLRGGAGLARGLAGGLIGAALTGVAAIGGEYLTDKFVKNKDDASSINRGLGAVSTGAGIGATIGSIIPGVGTVIGGAVGGLAGGAYSLFKDKNLRNFVGGKISSGAKAVGGFLGGVGHSIGNFFGGDDDKKDGKGHGGGGVMGALAGLAVGGPIGALLGGTGLGGKILDSLKSAGKGIGEFFTKTIPGWWNSGVKAITNFFTKTLPGLPMKAFNAITTGFGVLLGFFIYKLPQAVGNFFTKTIPHMASLAWGFIRHQLWEPFLRFVESIPGFFTKTIPRWFKSVSHWVYEHIDKPVFQFVTKKIPHFFAVTIPEWFKAAPHWFKVHIVDNMTAFFTQTLPSFFTKTLPNAISALPKFLYDNLVQPILDFFGGIAGHIGDFLKGSWDWATGLFSKGAKNVQAGMDSQKTTGKMSGGLIEGIYTGLEDRLMTPTSPGEFVVRRGATQQPYGKEFLRDFNEGRFNPADWYAGLSAQASPQVMSIVPPDAAGLNRAVPTVVNHTVNSGLSMGDITINNPVREKSEHSLRRQIQVAATRHRH